MIGLRWLTSSRLLAAGLVFLVALALRALFASHYLWAWDSVLYARALDGFDVAAGRPHPPGYILYIALARLARFVSADANGALVMVSIVSGAVTCAAGALIGRWRSGSAAGVITAGLLVANPLLWHYSEVAYPYALLAALSAGVGGLLWWARGRHVGAALLASFALGIAAGARQDLIAILGPLWLWSMLGSGRRALVVGSAAVALGSAVWLVPTAMLSGGLDRYAAVTWGQTSGVSSFGGSDPQSIASNALLTVIGIRWQVHWALPLVALGAWAVLRRRELRSAAAPLALWIAPALTIYVLFHIGEWAYTLSLAVPIALLGGIGGAELLRVTRGTTVRAVVGVGIAAALALNAHSFVVGEGRFSARAIEGHDTGLAIQIAGLRERFPAAETLLLAEGGYQHTRYYLPEYAAVYVPPGVLTTRRELASVAPGIRRGVLFLGEVRVRPRTTVHTLVLRGGVEVAYVILEPRARLVLHEDRRVSFESE